MVGYEAEMDEDRRGRDSDRGAVSRRVMLIYIQIDAIS